MDEHGMRIDHLEMLLLRLEQTGKLGRVKIMVGTEPVWMSRREETVLRAAISQPL